MTTILKRTRKPSNAEFSKLVRGFRGEFELLMRRYSQGFMSPRDWAEAMQRLCVDGHAESYAMGRQLAGDLADLSQSDFLSGLAVADRQAPYLLGFMYDLENGKYLDDDGIFQSSKTRARLNQYAHAMRGTATDAFINTSGDTIDFEWMLGAVEKHCSDCPRYAAMNPWTKDSLFAWPGSMDTPCLGNCKCHLRREDGATSFQPVDLNQ